MIIIIEMVPTNERRKFVTLRIIAGIVQNDTSPSRRLLSETQSQFAAEALGSVRKKTRVLDIAELRREFFVIWIVYPR